MSSTRNYSRSSAPNEFNFFTYASRAPSNRIKRDQTLNNCAPFEDDASNLRITSNKAHNLNLSDDFPALPASPKAENKTRHGFASPKEDNYASCWRDILISQSKKKEHDFSPAVSATKPIIKSDSSVFSCNNIQKSSPKRQPSKLFAPREGRDSRKEAKLAPSVWKDLPACPVFDKSIWSDLPSKSDSQYEISHWNDVSAKPKLHGNKLHNNFVVNSEPHKSARKSVSVKEEHIAQISGERGNSEEGMTRLQIRTDDMKIGHWNAKKSSNTDFDAKTNRFSGTRNKEESFGKIKGSDKSYRHQEQVNQQNQKCGRKEESTDLRMTPSDSKPALRNNPETQTKARAIVGRKPDDTATKNYDFRSNRPDFRAFKTGSMPKSNESSTSITGQKKTRKKRPSKIKRQAAMFSGKVVLIPAEVSAKLSGMKIQDDGQKCVVRELVDVSSTSEFPELSTINYSKRYPLKKTQREQDVLPSAITQNPSTANQDSAQAKNASEVLSIKVLTGSNPEGTLVKVHADAFAKSKESRKTSESVPSPVKSPLVKESPKVKICPREPISLADIFATSAPKQKEKKKKNEADNKIVSKKSSQVINVLDSSGPVVKRGKEREKPKVKKYSHLKKIILKEREQRKEKLKNLIKAAEQYLKSQASVSRVSNVEEVNSKAAIRNILTPHSFVKDSKKSTKTLDFGTDTIVEILGEHTESKQSLESVSKDHGDVPDYCSNWNDSLNYDGSDNLPNDNLYISSPKGKISNVVIHQQSEENSKAGKISGHASKNKEGILDEEHVVPESQSEISHIIYDCDEKKTSDSCFPCESSFEIAEPVEITKDLIDFSDDDVEQAVCIEKDHTDLESSEKAKSPEAKESVIWKEIVSNSCNVCNDVFLKMSGYASKKSSDPLSSEAPVTPKNSEENRKKAIKIVMHTKNFREYCTHLLSKKLDESVQQLLEDLARFQDRLHQKDPVKAHMKRRLVYGIKEVTKKCKLKKLKCIIVAPNVENIQSEGGLNDALGDLIRIAGEYHVPCVFAMERKLLGKLCKKPVPVSCVGIFNFEGSEVSFKTVLELYDESVKDYKELYSIIESNIQDEAIANLLRANENAPGTLLGYRMKVLRSALMTKADHPSKPVILPEYEKFVAKYMIKM